MMQESQVLDWEVPAQVLLQVLDWEVPAKLQVLDCQVLDRKVQLVVQLDWQVPVAGSNLHHISWVHHQFHHHAKTRLVISPTWTGHLQSQQSQLFHNSGLLLFSYCCYGFQIYHMFIIVIQCELNCKVPYKAIDGSIWHDNNCVMDCKVPYLKHLQKRAGL